MRNKKIVVLSILAGFLFCILAAASFFVRISSFPKGIILREVSSYNGMQEIVGNLAMEGSGVYLHEKGDKFYIIMHLMGEKCTEAQYHYDESIGDFTFSYNTAKAVGNGVTRIYAIENYRETIAHNKDGSLFIKKNGADSYLTNHIISSEGDYLW